MSQDDFFIGYKPKAPKRLAGFLRRTTISLILIAAALALVLTMLQKPFDPGSFEFGVVRQFEGIVVERPVPTLLAEPPGAPTDRRSRLSPMLLVSAGKFGAAERAAGLHGRRVSLDGTLIERGDDRMIELVPGSIREIGSAVDPPGPVELGEHTLTGEIVDSKCYLGVMKPGREKTHRACAVRCISGGVPPILRITGAGDQVVHLLLVGSDGMSINRQILDFVAEPVEITGRLQRTGQQLVLLTDRSSIRRLRG